MPVVLAGLILSFLTMMLFGDSELDRTLLVLLDGNGLTRLNQVATIVHWCAQPLPLLVLILAATGLLLALRRWRNAALLGGIAIAGWLLTVGAQHFTLPARPMIGANPMAGAVYPDISAALATIAGFATAFLLTRRAPARGWALVAAAAFALAAGIAAIMAERAWPSSVVGGWALGLAWVLSVLMIARTDIGDGTRER
jgi:undecaprenyl-diphosphatase